MTYTEEEVNLLRELSNNINDQVSELQKMTNYNTIEVCKDMSYPIEHPSFNRLNKILNDPNLESFFSTEERKRAFLSADYWKLKERVPRVLLFPKEPQPSVVIIAFTGIVKDGELEIREQPGAIYEAIIRSTDGKNLKAPYNREKNSIIALMFEGETLHFESANYKWRVRLENISNPGPWRNKFDFAKIYWIAEKIK